jgi:hypothetical protein
MGTLFVPIEDDASFSIQGSNYSVVANFSSDLDNVFLRTFANDASNVGFLWGVSNVTPSAPKMIVGAIRSGANSNIPQNDLTIYNGNVGVGVTNVAQYKLEVHGDINYTGDLLSKGSRLNMFALNDKVGVGTNAPAALLEVANLSAAGPALRVVQKTQITGGNGNIAELFFLIACDGDRR